MLFSEVDPFPSAVLKHRYPRVPNLGDITKIDWKEAVRAFGRPDVVVGGSPCQSFSIAGDRTGLEGASGLMWEYVRCIREVVPRWLLWENVPGALSSSNGEDYRCLLEALDALGYGLAWRVLDAQFFGVPQRRERVFLVGCLGDPGGACEVLFEPESLRWDTPSSREKRSSLAARAAAGAEVAGGRVSAGFGYKVIQGSAIGRAPGNGPCGPGWCDPEENGSYTLTAVDRHAVVCMTDATSNAMVSGEVSGTLTAHHGVGGSDNC